MGHGGGRFVWLVLCRIERPEGIAGRDNLATLTGASEVAGLARLEMGERVLDLPLEIRFVDRDTASANFRQGHHRNCLVVAGKTFSLVGGALTASFQ
jgi:hypothetical protein